MNDTDSLSDVAKEISGGFLAQEWAKKYLQNLLVDTEEQENPEQINWSEIVSTEGRKQTSQKILTSLRTVSAKAWSKTEFILSEQVKLHRIDANVINPWDIAADSFKIYQKALDVYAQSETADFFSPVNQLAEKRNLVYDQALEAYIQNIAPVHLAKVIGADLGAIRKKYTTPDPRVIGFVSLQFHYTGQMLLEELNPYERSLVGAYFKVVDDHLYMPLQRAYEAAAKHDYNSPVIMAVQKLLPVSTKIAKKICKRVIELFPNYTSMSGSLHDSIVKTSSVRDVEMFQVYLWLSALEGNISAIQEELFPLCVMLYPTLKVEWELVRQMLHLLRFEIQEYLTPEQVNTLMPSFQTLSLMFSSELLE
ncbi:hypothetical protein B6N60_02916 [Richelia sinica FACHB-800]|uniref:Uncharacterized protein n=1 Tax=Richelia sinica FACHB-800 TaxID=1357546 RepID=A0A975TA08_9NOST|nr:hypothetical protein [Richelia sinica]QXE24212.1 hypothetical protein B6N60_02916 [Richelia sinica FACHB-800]